MMGVIHETLTRVDSLIDPNDYFLVVSFHTRRQPFFISVSENFARFFFNFDLYDWMESSLFFSQFHIEKYHLLQYHLLLYKDIHYIVEINSRGKS